MLLAKPLRDLEFHITNLHSTLFFYYIITKQDHSGTLQLISTQLTYLQNHITTYSYLQFLLQHSFRENKTIVVVYLD